MAVVVYTATGNKSTSTAKLDKHVFHTIPENYELLKRAYLAYLANGRINSANTKTRGEVRGGGKKPWRQKGTGRARFGSSRVPIWRGGGITFGPTGEENYEVIIPLNQKRLALRQALSLAVQDNKLSIIEDLKIKGNKTAEANKLMQKVGATGSVLLVVDDKTDAITRPFNNMSNVHLVQPNYLTTFDILNADHIILSGKTVEALHNRLGAKK